MTPSIENPKVTVIRQQVHFAYEELQQLVAGPLAEVEPVRLYQPASPGEWSVMENLSHIIEFMPYWADQIAQLVAAPGKNFGRTQQHEGRQRAILEHGNDRLDQARDALPGSYAHLDTVLSSLTDDNLTLTGHHSKFGEKTLDWFIDEFVTQHLINHVQQIKACL